MPLATRIPFEGHYLFFYFFVNQVRDVYWQGVNVINILLDFFFFWRYFGIPCQQFKLDEVPTWPDPLRPRAKKKWGGPAQLDPLLKKELKMQVCLFSFGHGESLELAMARCRRHRRK